MSMEYGDEAEYAEEEGAQRPNSKWGGRGGKGGRSISTFKCLCPDVFMSHLIGVGGATRKALEEDTGTRIKISGRDEFYPNSRYRTLSVIGEDNERVVAALERIVNQLVEFAQVESTKGKGKGDDLLGKEDGEYVFRTPLPKVASGRFIGPQGSNIKQLREKSGAKVFVDNETQDDHQLVRVIGSVDQIMNVLPRIMEAIANEMSEADLADWAHTCSFRGGGGKEGGKRGSGGGGKGGGSKREREDGHRGYDDYADRWKDGQGAPPPPPPGKRMRPGEFRPEAILDILPEFPPGAPEMSHAITCDLDSRCVGALIGRKGEYVIHVERETGCEVTFNEVPKGSDVEMRTLTIQGPLINVYAAHMMMMKRYHEGQAQAREEPRTGTEKPHIEDLQYKLAELTRQLEEARRGGGGAGAGGKGQSRGRR